LPRILNSLKFLNYLIQTHSNNHTGQVSSMSFNENEKKRTNLQIFQEIEDLNETKI